MPIRFRCPACGGVLSIATRKAGSQVACPKCRANVLVPGPQPVAAAAAPAADDRPLFERDDFEKLFDTPGAAAPRPEPAEAAPTREEPVPRAVEDDGILISRGAAVILGVLMLVLLAMAFATGYLIGR